MKNSFQGTGTTVISYETERCGALKIRISARNSERRNSYGPHISERSIVLKVGRSIKSSSITNNLARWSSSSRAWQNSARSGIGRHGLGVV